MTLSARPIHVTALLLVGLLLLVPAATAQVGIAKVDDEGYACAGLLGDTASNTGQGDILICADAREGDLCYVLIGHEGHRTCPWLDECHYGAPPCLFVQEHGACLRDAHGRLCVYETERELCVSSYREESCSAKCVNVYPAAVCERTPSDMICIDIHKDRSYGGSPLSFCHPWPPQA